MRALVVSISLLAFAASLTLACGPAEPEAPAAAPATKPSDAAASPAAPAARAASAYTEAQEIFDMRCVTCHGARGAGDGPGSASLTPAPRNFQDPDWQASVSDDHLGKIIQYGGAAVGRSAAMPGFTGDWYVTGRYPTPGGYRVLNRSYLNWRQHMDVRAY